MGGKYRTLESIFSTKNISHSRLPSIFQSSNRMKADIELTRFGRIMKTDLKRRRHMGGTWLLMLDVSA